MVTWQDNSLLSHDEWLSSRNKTIGASEIGAIIFGSKWTSNLEIWYNKVSGSKNKNYNIRMFLGHKTEQLSSEMWENYDGTEQSIVENDRKGTPVKKCINLNATAFNSDLPHLSATPDRIIIPYGKYADMVGNGCLEMKNTQSRILAAYDKSLPPENVVQLVAQLMCSGYGYGEIFYFLDNARFELHAIKKDDTKKIQEIILSHTLKFWKSVEKARPLYNQLFEARRTFNMRLAGQLEYELASLEPEPQNSVGYLNFITNRYKDRVAGVGNLKGTDEQLLIAKKHAELGRKIDKIESEQRKLEIELKGIIKDNSCLDFGKHGKVSWYANKNDKRIFKNSVK